MATGTPSIAETPSGAISRSSTLSSGHSATPCFASSRIIVVAEVVEAHSRRVLAYLKFDTRRHGVTPWRRGTPAAPSPPASAAPRPGSGRPGPAGRRYCDPRRGRRHDLREARRPRGEDPLHRHEYAGDTPPDQR